MILVVTVFKTNPGLTAAIDPAIRAGIEKKMLETGKMLFFHGPLRYIGPEVNDTEWDEAVVYAFRDLDAMHEWGTLAEHVAIDHDYTARGVLQSAFGFQLTDDLDPDLPNKMAARLREMNKDRSRWPEGVDLPAIRLGSKYATRPDGG